MDEDPVMSPIHPGVILREEFLAPLGVTAGPGSRWVVVVLPTATTTDRQIGKGAPLYTRPTHLTCMIGV